jgi:hypothetical protein
VAYIRGFPGAKAPDSPTKFVVKQGPFAPPVGPKGGFISAAPQIANYALVAGLGFFSASAVTPQGQANASEYQFGTHAAAIHNAEAIKSKVWKSVPTPPVATSQVPRFVSSAPQSVDLTQQPAIFKSAPTPIVVSTPLPFRLVQAGPEQVDLSISGWVAESAPMFQGAPPASIWASPQTDPTQIAAQIWKPAATPPAVSGFLGTYVSVPAQIEERPTRQVWPSQISGQTPPVIKSIWAAPQIVDLTLQAVILGPAITPPVVSYAVPQLYASPQLIDLTQQGWIRGTAPMGQGPVPPLTFGIPQTDPTQIAPSIWQSVPTPPAILGVTVQPNTPVPPQFDTSVNSTVLWTPSTFSPSAPPAPPSVTVSSGGPTWFYKPYPKKKKRKIVELENVVIIPSESPELDEKRIYRYFGELAPELKNIRIQMIEMREALAYAKQENTRIERQKKLDRDDDEFLILLSL